jgi:hypothetical protein
MAFIVLKIENIFQLVLSYRLVAPLIAATSLNFRQPENVQVDHYFLYNEKTMKMNFRLCFGVRGPNIPVSVACCPYGTTNETKF